MTWRRRILSIPFVFALLAACGSGGSDATTAEPSATPPTATPSSEPASSPTLRDPAEAQKVLDEAVRRMAALDAVQLTAKLNVGDLGGFTISALDLIDGGWRATTNIEAVGLDDRYVMNAVSANGSVWMQMQGWSGANAGCWLSMSPTQVPLGYYAMGPDDLGYLQALAELKAIGFTGSPDDTMQATLRADMVQFLLNGTTTTQLKLNELPMKKFDVPLVVELLEGKVSAIRMQGTDFLHAVEQAKAKLSQQERDVLTSMGLVVTYSPGKPEQIQRPDSDLIYGAGEKGCRKT